MQEAVRAARGHTGVSAATLSLYVTFRRWPAHAQDLRPHAMILAKMLDMWLKGQALESMDLCASRLMALVQYVNSGNWRVAEGLQTVRTRVEGLAP